MNDDYLKHLSDKDRVAVLALSELIREQVIVVAGEKQPDEVWVLTWYDDDDQKIGLRVSEVGLVWRGEGASCSGASYMRCDVEASAVILRAEDYLLNYYEQPYRPPGWESDIDEKADAAWRLLHALNGPEGSEADDRAEARAS